MSVAMVWLLLVVASGGFVTRHGFAAARAVLSVQVDQFRGIGWHTERLEDRLETRVLTDAMYTAQKFNVTGDRPSWSFA